MSSTVKWDLSNLHVLGAASAAISSSVASALDFGTPNDLFFGSNAGSGSGYVPGDRVLLAISGYSGGTTDKLVLTIQDADDSSGSIGTPATAVTSYLAGAATAAAAGTAYALVAVEVQYGRPWLRVKAAINGTSDTIDVHCVALGVPGNV